jgi:hypothetical protein
MKNVLIKVEVFTVRGEGGAIVYFSILPICLYGYEYEYGYVLNSIGGFQIHTAPNKTYVHMRGGRHHI